MLSVAPSIPWRGGLAAKMTGATASPHATGGALVPLALPVVPRLLVAQGVDGPETGGSMGGVDTEEDAYGR